MLLDRRTLLATTASVLLPGTPEKEQVEQLPFRSYIKTKYLREQRFDIINRVLLNFTMNFPELKFPPFLIENGKINPCYYVDLDAEYTNYELIQSRDKKAFWLLVFNDENTNARLNQVYVRV